MIRRVAAVATAGALFLLIANAPLIAAVLAILALAFVAGAAYEGMRRGGSMDLARQVTDLQYALDVRDRAAGAATDVINGGTYRWGSDLDECKARHPSSRGRAA